MSEHTTGFTRTTAVSGPGPAKVAMQSGTLQYSCLKMNSNRFGLIPAKFGGLATLSKAAADLAEGALDTLETRWFQ
jgi:hypothetical protein